MKKIKSITFLGIIALIVFVAGCSLDNPAGTDAVKGLPVEVQQAIDSGAAVNVNLSATTRSITGEISGQPVLFPSNYSDVKLRETPAIRITLTLTGSVSNYDTYIFYVNSLPAITISNTDYVNRINTNAIAAFLPRPVGGGSYSVVVFALSKNGYLQVSGSYSYSGMVWYGAKILYDPGCEVPDTPYTDNTAWNNSSPYKNLRIRTSTGIPSYWVYKQGEWQKDVNGFAGGCTYGDPYGNFTGLLAYPPETPKLFADAAKIGFAYRLCSYPNYAWSAWGYGEVSYCGTSPRRQSVTVSGGVIGFQISLYMC